MAVNAHVPRSDEDRLAALWEQPLDGATVGDSIDDGIAALFSASDDSAPRAAPHHGAGGTHRSQARRPGRGGRRRSRARRAGPQPASRSLAIGAALIVALVSAMIALSTSTGSSDSADMPSPAETDQTTVLSPPARQTPVETEIRRAAATRFRAQRGRQHRGRATGARPERSRAAQPARAVPTRKPHPVRSTRRRSEPAAAPQTAPRRRIPPPTAPVSSACDEFPPC